MGRGAVASAPCSPAAAGRTVRDVEMTAYEPGTPSWVDLGVADIDAAVSFYEQLFGWKATDPGPVEETGGYRMFQIDGKPVAGIGPQQQPGAPFWTTYFSVASADETATAVHDAGGQVFVEPMDVLTAGRMAVAADSSGAAFSIWEPREHIGAVLVNEPGTLCWNELYTRDPSGSLTFYSEVFGLGSRSADGAHFELLRGSSTVAGVVFMDQDSFPPEVPSHWIAYFAVDDCDAALATAERLGALEVGEPADAPVGRYAMVTDPQGAIFSVIALSSPGG
jgi:predicted enzyme related to lactoylglutathione lyase